MKYLIGIDGGGTKTDCAIADLSGKIIHQTTGKPSNFLVIGVEEAIENVFALIEENLFALEGDFADVKKQIVIGVAGAGREEDAKLLEKRFLKTYADQERNSLQRRKSFKRCTHCSRRCFPEFSRMYFDCRHRFDTFRQR